MNSAGLLMCRKQNDSLEFFLVHPGGPYYMKKNEGVWSIPKGIPDDGEDLLLAAQREFYEETCLAPHPPFYSLGSLKTKAGKIIHAWTFLGEWDSSQKITSNTFPMEWPPRSGKRIMIPEVDRAEWMTFEKAVKMINPNQIPFLERAKEALGIST
jgi:predicted NUDIX family NTP pyrophosphohydrolase